MSADCVFCRILAGQAPASIVHRDPLCTAFLDNRPLNPGHLLVVPNLHADRLADLPPDDIYAAFAGWHVQHEDIYEAPVDSLSDPQRLDAVRLERRLRDAGYDAIVPQTLGCFFGDKALVATAMYHSGRSPWRKNERIVRFAVSPIMRPVINLDSLFVSVYFDHLGVGSYVYVEFLSQFIRCLDFQALWVLDDLAYVIRQTTIRV